MSGHHQASHERSHDFSDHFLPADEAGMLLSMTASSSLSVLPSHSIFRPAAHLIPSSGQSLTSSSAVPLFAVTSLQDSAATVYTLVFSSSRVYTFLTAFISNVLSKDCTILTYQNLQYESHVSASADVLSAQMILK
ncbi:uncharacterized protein BDCG_16998 [Blastomyces dermatitidis ER-3]|uniref:Uncharacterized protein n=1 Tax=Ajellomyces dermatitidis (strain ER-3 / ATCC MYA-2586) TaxID=559297 RepID=A0ABX2VW51_AJEDR|nr:uncharacterized protein BDCG_16998 [Blastomyces dermatitidis ER-3]OAT01246.1 hypothetical protein BDCG_16998 [Blastomyces dermatitidis ER-3]